MFNSSLYLAVFNSSPELISPFTTFPSVIDDKYFEISQKREGKIPIVGSK